MSAPVETKRVAEGFVMRAVQDWGQSVEQRVAAVQSVLDAAGFDAKATCVPVFGALWPQPCDGREAAEATAWLNTLTETMPRGRFESEAAHVAAAIEARASRKVQP